MNIWTLFALWEILHKTLRFFVGAEKKIILQLMNKGIGLLNLSNQLSSFPKTEEFKAEEQNITGKPGKFLESWLKTMIWKNNHVKVTYFNLIK